MARIHVHGADLDGDTIKNIRVSMHNLPSRTIDRDTAVRWARDGHSFITRAGKAVQVVEIPGDDITWVLRLDNAASPADDLGELPSVSEAT